MLKTKRNFLFLTVVFLLGVIAFMPPTMSQAKTNGTYHLELWFDNSGHYGDTEDSVATLLKSQLEATGVFDVQLQSTDWATYKSQFGTMPVFLLGWWFDYPDESNYIDPFVGSGAFDLGTNYSSSTMDGYINTMLTSSNAATRATAQKDAQGLMATDVPVIPLFTMTKQFVVYGKDMTGVTLEPSETMHFNTFKKGSTVTAVTLGTTDSIPKLDPSDVYEYWSSNTLVQLSHGLMELPTTSTTATPMLAQSYTISSDGLKYTFNLKPNVMFSDNTPVRPEDVIWSLNRSASLNGDPSFLLDGIDSSTYTKINSTALSFNLTAVDGTFLQKLTYTNAFVYKQDNAINNTIQGGTYAPVGCGPYYVDSWTPNDQIVLKANGNYSSAALGTNAPDNTQVTVKFFTTSSNLKTAVTSGTVDVAFHTFTPDEINALEADTTVNHASKATAGTRYVVINVQAVPDVNVRKSMSLAVDRQEFVDTIFNGTNLPLYSMVPSIFSNACVKGDSCAFPEGGTTAALSQIKTLMPTYGTSSTVASGSSSGSSSSSAVPGFELVPVIASFAIVAIVAYRKKKE